MTDAQRAKIQAYADQHGATLSGALVALAARGLDAIDAATATAATKNQRKQTFEDVPLPFPACGFESPSGWTCKRRTGHTGWHSPRDPK